MTKIVIIGSSPAGFTTAKRLAEAHKEDLEIAIVSAEESLPYRNDLLLEFLSGRIKKKELFLCEESFFGNNKIRFLRSTKVGRLDTKRQQVILKDNSRLNYDYLVIAGSLRLEIPDVAGKTKDAVFGFSTLKDAESILQQLVISDTVCLAGDSELLVGLSEMFLAKDKVVKIISKNKPESFSSTEKVEWINYAGLLEIIGDGSELKAVKLDNGKAIGVSMVIFLEKLIPYTEFLKDSNINLQEGFILVDNNFRSNQENIFACGSSSRCIDNPGLKKNWLEEEKEGLMAAENILISLERRTQICPQTS